MGDIFLFDNAVNMFFWIGAVGTGLYILKMLMYFLTGADIEVDSTFNTISDTDSSFSFISIETALAFFMGFGWSGYSALVQFKTSVLIAFIAAFAVGLMFMFISAYLLFSVKKLEKIPKYDLNELMGKTGKAYTSFKPKSSGQIEIDFNGCLSILDAYNITEEEIKSFTLIKVEKVEDNKIYISQGE